MNDFDTIILQVMVNCEDILLECEWKYRAIPCSELFVLRSTDQGLCCGFNHVEMDWKFGNDSQPT